MKLTLVTGFVSQPDTGRVPTRVAFVVSTAANSMRCVSNICRGSIIPQGASYLLEDGGTSILCQNCLNALFAGPGVRIAGIQLD